MPNLKERLLHGTLSLSILLILCTCGYAVTPEEQDCESQASSIINSTGVHGGLIVHLGCGPGELTAALHLNNSYLVHGLDKDAQNIAKARDHISAKGIYGKVSVEQWSQTSLPYNDNVVNLLIAEDLQGVSMDEVMRVLCPRGVAYIRHGEKWQKTVKPWPDEIDVWTHFLHGADNNAVAKDTRVATPNHLQWQAEPKRTRDHDALASISAMTSSNGRIFYILDEGPTSLSHHPAQWKLIARDAFNGKLLWKRDLDSWMTHLRYFRTGPTQLPRRLVSIGDRVYVTLGFTEPVSALDAKTGKTLLRYDGSERVEEFICADGVLLAVVGDPPAWNSHTPKIDNYWEFYDEEGPEVAKSIIACDVETAKQLWKIEGDNLIRLAPLSLTSGDEKVFYLDNKKLYCVDLHSGKQLWEAPFPTYGLFLRNYAPTVVHYKDTVACLSLDALAVFSTADGRKLWQNKGYAGFASPGDLFVIDDVIWTFPGTQGIKVKPQDVPGEGKKFVAFDLYTGKTESSLVKKRVWPGGHHHRCYRNKATERYLISGRRGLEFVDLKGDNNVINWWVRGICQYGIMPCNGLIYVPPHPCKCFSNMKFDGFHALAAQDSISRSPTQERLLLHQDRPSDLSFPRKRESRNDNRRLSSLPADHSRVDIPLTKRRAYGEVDWPSHGTTTTTSAGKAKNLLWTPPVANCDPQEWPTYRHDITRSGCATTQVPLDLTEKWSTDLGGRLSSVVVAAGKLLVSAVDRQTLYCLDAQNGKQLWRFIADGRVDSPPTVCGPVAVFGCRDGCVYALRISDGELIWRFRATPVDRRTVVGDRLESVWPIHGSVLVIDDTVYFAAGHTSYLDGGIRLYGLDVASGAVRHERILTSKGVDMDGLMPDVLISDGPNITMRHKNYDRTLQETKKPQAATIVADTGLLEDCWGHRWNWQLGGRDTFGKLLVFDEATAYGVQSYYTFLKHDNSMHPDTHTGHLHQKYSRYTEEQFPIGTRLFAQSNTKPENLAQNRKKKLTLEGNRHKWNRDTQVQFRAMVLAGDMLFAAGWKDAVTLSENNPAPRSDSALMVISTADGNTLKQYPLKAEPVFDGMAAACRKLYLSLKDGSVICLHGPTDDHNQNR